MNHLYPEEDMYVGYWLKDVPYEPKRMEYPKGGRKYIFHPNYDLENRLYFQACNSSYFEKNYASLIYDAYMNGRTYYPPMQDRVNKSRLSKKDIVIPDYNAITSPCRELLPRKILHVNIASLICTQLAKGKRSWSEIFSLLEKCDMYSDCYECTPIGHKIAASLIRIASTRIFADPEQSILELPVNSIDSYFPESRVGKFGMGFFSFLYWLVDHPLRLLHIYSFYEEDGKYCTFHVILNHLTDGFHMSLQVLESAVTTSGTYIYMDCQEDKLSRETLDLMEQQIEKLRFMKNGRLYWSFSRVTFDLYQQRLKTLKNVPRSDSVGDVYVYCDPEKIIVEDYAKGIPIHVLLGSLFVPSISTKTIQSQITIPYDWRPNNEYTINENNYSTYSIIVNGVAVVDFRDDTRKNVSLSIEMPPTTRLPVSRDDIILDEVVFNEYNNSILELYGKALNTGNFMYADTFINKYMEFTSSVLNKKISGAIKDAIHRRYGDRIVTQNMFLAIGDIFPDAILADKMDMRRVERQILDTVPFRADIFQGKEVIFSEKINTPNTYGSVRLLFIPLSITQKEAWTDLVSLSMPELRLSSDSNVQGMAKYEEIMEATPEYLRENTDALNTVASFFGLENRASIDSRQITLFLNYLRNFSSEKITEICRSLYEVFNSLKPNISYGTLSLSSFEIVEMSETLICHTSSDDKLEEFNLQSLLITLQSVKGKIVLRLYAPTMFHPSVIYAYYVWKNINPEIYEALLVMSMDLYEFTFTALAIAKTNLTIPVNDPSSVRYILQMVRKYSLVENDLKQLYMLNDTGCMYPAEMYKYSLNKFLSEEKYRLFDNITYDVEEYVRMTSLLNIQIPAPLLKIEQEPVSLLLNKLGSYLFRYSPSSNIRETFEKAGEYEESVGLQTLEIAVNEGTTKDFVGACLTELVQNSVDAIRTSRTNRNKIEISYAHEDESFFILQVRDEVGIPPEGFLSLSIPFLSTKVGSAVTTGEMGSGFFNVYRESTLVIINTVWNGMNYIAIDEPVRIGKRVVDVRRTFYERPTDLENGTSIYMKTIELPREYIVGYMGKASYTCLRLFPLLTVFNNIELSVNGVNVEMTSKEIIATYNNIDIYVGENFPSYIFTNGISYSPLENYFINYNREARSILDTGIVVNIRGGYSPVQSRTRIILSPANKKSFEDAVEYAIFLRILNYYYYSPPLVKKTIYNHYDSTASASQLMLSKPFMPLFHRSVANIFNQPIPFILGNLSIPELTNELIKVMGNRSFDDAEADLVREINTFRPIAYTKVFDMLEVTVLDWFKLKNKNVKSITTDDKKTTGESEKKEKSFDKHILLSYLEEFLKIYDEMASELQITNWRYQESCKKIVIYSEDTNTLGYYYNEVMHINVNGFTKEDINDFIKQVTTLANPRDFEQVSSIIWKRLFQFKYPARTFIHEIEHARRNQKHMEGSHDKYLDELFPGDETKERGYDDTAIDFYRHLILNGFYGRLFNAYKNLGR